jgi:ribonuclease Z
MTSVFRNTGAGASGGGGGVRQETASSSSTAGHSSRSLLFDSVTYLGTSSGVSTKQRNVSSAVISFEGNKRGCFLIDCGDGTHGQLLKCSHLSLNNVKMILITHLHGDHVYGLPAVLSAMAMSDCKNTIEICGPMNLGRYLRSIVDLTQPRSPKMRITELLPADVDRIKHEREAKEDMDSKKHKLDELEPAYITPDADGIYRVPCEGLESLKAVALTHRVFSLGYIFTERDSISPINLKADEIVIKYPGRFEPRKDFYNLKRAAEEARAEGHEDFEFSSAGCARVKVEDIISGGEELKGRSYVHLGDTEDSSNVLKLLLSESFECDFLSHECTFESGLEEEARKKGHSSAKMTGEFAASVRAKCTFLTHFSAKYHRNIPNILAGPAHEPRDVTVNDLRDQVEQAYRVYCEKNSMEPPEGFKVKAMQDLCRISLRRGADVGELVRTALVDEA